MRKSFFALLTLLMMGVLSPVGAVAEADGSRIVDLLEHQPNIKEDATWRDCPDDSVCFFTKTQFVGTLVYYQSPRYHTCGNIPRRPAYSVINNTNMKWTVYKELDCKGSDYDILGAGQAKDINYGANSWK
ncbi:peptidase inhibitor family I36 protein [Saccharothrix sp. BKS2]|uniref:peptidase inhibitor family I36 protein n=1 Tax=Saccharothrix sp. BKS2 TaxID=3064400 RepID=UPI0039E7F3B8